jgi:hypothetical protein
LIKPIADAAVAFHFNNAVLAPTFNAAALATLSALGELPAKRASKMAA